MSGLADDATGPEVVAGLAAEAARRGIKVKQLVYGLSTWPQEWLRDTALRTGLRPKTIARVRALIAAEPIPPSQAEAPEHKRAHRRLERQRPPGAPMRVSGPATKQAPPAAPIDREPCFYCGVRGEIGCAHRRRG